MMHLDERGFVTAWAMVFMSLIVVLIIFHMEGQRLFWTREKMVTAADAASLAGASTAELIPGDVTYSYDGSEITENVGKWDTEIHKPDADAAAYPTAQLNMPEFSQWSSNVTGQNTYTFDISNVRVRSILERIIGKQMYINSTGSAKATVKAP